LTLDRCIAHGNSVDGVALTGSGGSLTATLAHVTLDQNGEDGLEIAAATASDSTTVTISNSIVTRNVSHGAIRDVDTGTTSLTVTTCDFWSNGIDFWNLGGAEARHDNPLYVSSNDLTLTSNSPLRFGGSGGEDMGALPFAGRRDTRPVRVALDGPDPERQWIALPGRGEPDRPPPAGHCPSTPESRWFSPRPI
jgi:hypothetical protein